VLSTFDRYQRIAPVYDLLELPFEYGRYRQIRRLLFQGLSGRVLDAGVGTGGAPFNAPQGSVRQKAEAVCARQNVSRWPGLHQVSA
jgi:ubiquinone/menaquinone biosynthesis C-methylase UbiE